jgi:putative flippase GtrA
MLPRTLTFAAVGLAGFTVQAVVLTLLTTARWPIAIATLTAVEAAVMLNFCCHMRWTWRDRLSPVSTLVRLGRFHIANGMTSLVANVAITSVGANLFHLNPVVANACAVVGVASINYVWANRWVFARALPLVGLMVATAPAPARAAELQLRTLAAWEAHVGRIENSRPFDSFQHDGQRGEPRGRTIDVPGGTIHEWRGSTIVRHTTVPALVRALIGRGTPPPQEDVLESRVLDRRGDALRVYLKIVRSAVVAIAYETEHDVQFACHSASLATSRSVATRIVEAGGEDHGFLWRLNSYWRYRQVGDAVHIDMLSISLSRSVPTVLKPVAAPLVNHIARDSMIGALAAVQRFGEHLPNDGRD